MKLFEPEHIQQKKRKRRIPVKKIAGILYVLLVTVLSIILITNLMNKETEKPKLGPFDRIEMDNGFLMCEKVIYGKKSTVDSDDQSHIFYHVLSAPAGSKWQKGDLVKARHIMEQDYDGSVKTLIHIGNVQFGIKKENL